MNTSTNEDETMFVDQKAKTILPVIASKDDKAPIIVASSSDSEQPLAHKHQPSPET